MMMLRAETAAKEEHMSREDCDEWALGGHRKACAAIDAVWFLAEIVPVAIEQPKNDPLIFDRDENPRADTTMEKLRKLQPVFAGVCTAVNSFAENDGAAVVVLMSAQRASQPRLEAMAVARACELVGDDPRRACRTVSAAVEKALNRAGADLSQTTSLQHRKPFIITASNDMFARASGPGGT